MEERKLIPHCRELPRYWDVVDGEPFPAPNPDRSDPTSPLFYLSRALAWMDKYGLKASMDLHTGKRSSDHKKNLWQDPAHKMVTTTVGGEERSGGQLETIPKKDPTLTGWLNS